MVALDFQFGAGRIGDGCLEEVQLESLCACTGSGVHQQGRGSQALRIWCESGVAMTDRSSFVVYGLAFPSRGYRGPGVTDTQIFISGQKRRVNAWLKCLLKRRLTIEDIRNEKLLVRNYLKGTEDDQMSAMLSCAEHNMRIIVNKIRIFCDDYFLASDRKNQRRSLLSGDAVDLPETGYFRAGEFKYSKQTLNF